MNKNMDCVFCKIANKEIKSNVVFESEKLLAFLDVNPQAPVHILIVPKKHIAGLNEIETADRELLCDIQLAARDIAKKQNISKTGYRLVANSGPDAGQAVGHLHYHLLGGRKFGWPPG